MFVNEIGYSILSIFLLTVRSDKFDEFQLIFKLKTTPRQYFVLQLYYYKH